LVEPENASAWQSTLVKLIDNTAAREALGARARTYTEAHYHWQTISQKYVSALEKIMK